MRLALIGLALIGNAGPFLYSAEEEAKRSYQLPRNMAVRSIKQAALQGNIEIFFTDSVVYGVVTPSIQGEYTPQDALDLLLEGTPLVAVRDSESGAFAIINRAKKGGNDPERSEEQESTNTTTKTTTDTEEMIKLSKINTEQMKSALLRGLMAVTGVLGTQLVAQESESDNEVYELSPFSVDSSGDTGYYATETLSGTTLRTDLRSLANPITVMTDEMMADIGADNYERAVEFMPSTTTYYGDTADFDANEARTGTPFISRGFRVEALTENFLSTDVKQDNFNTERLTQSRGPNSVLFGLGSVGGALNSGSKRARLNKDGKQFEVQFDDNGTTRYVVDLNKVLVEDKLALRMAFLYEDKRTFRDLQYRRRKSGYVNLTYKASEKTTVNANAEWGRFDENNPRFYMTKDKVSAWYSNPLAPEDKANYTDLDLILNGTNGQRSAARGAVRGLSAGFDTTSTTTQIMNDPSLPIMNWAWKSEGDFTYVNGVRARETGITDPQVTEDVYYPIDTVVAGPSDAFDVDYTKYSINWEQQLLENTYLNVIYGLEERSTDDYRPVDRGLWMLHIDNNYYLPTQRIADNPDPDQPLNPYFGLPYIESRTSLSQGLYKTDQFRTTLSHEQTFGEADWLGKLSLVGTYYTKDSDNLLYRMNEFNSFGVNKNGTIRTTGAQNVIRRYYLTGDNPPHFPSLDPWTPMTQTVDPSYGSHLGADVNEAPGAFIVPSVQSALFNRLEPIRDYENTESYYFLGQWRLWKDRIMLTAGTREDKITTDTASYTTDPAYSSWFYTDLDAWTMGEPDDNKTTNTNYGIVVRPHHMFDFFYNQSTNTVAAGSTFFTVFGDQLPNEEGEGWDAGFRTFLFDDNMIVKLNYFENDGLNKPSSSLRDGGNIGIGLARDAPNGRVERFLEGMEYNDYGALIAGALRFDDYPGIKLWTDVENELTTGYELEVTYNPSARLRMMLNVTLNEAKLNDTYVTFKPWYEQYIAPIKSRPEILALEATPDLSTDGQTIGGIIDEIDRKLQFHEAQVGGQQVRSSAWKANFVGSYALGDTGPLKGVRVGTSARWREAPVLGFYEDDGVFLVDQPIIGLETFIADAFVTKGWSDSADRRWEATLRIRNLFNDDGWFPNTAIDDGTGNPHYLQQILMEPRTFEFQLTTKY